MRKPSDKTSWLINDIDALLRDAISNGGPRSRVERRQDDEITKWRLYPSTYTVELDHNADELRLVNIDLRVDDRIQKPHVYAWDLVEVVRDAHATASMAWGRHLRSGGSEKDARNKYQWGFQHFIRGDFSPSNGFW